MTKCPHTAIGKHAACDPGAPQGRTGLHRLLAPLGIEPTPGAELMHQVRMAAQLYDSLMLPKHRVGNLSPPQLSAPQLSPARLRLLLCLFAYELQGETSLNPTRLSRELSLSKNTISAHLRALEELGLVERTTDPNDLRQFQIQLAESGRACIRRSVPDHMSYLDRLAQDLTPTEVTQLSQLLVKLIASLRAHGQDGCTGHDSV
ncbi:MAG: helix-turn-helix domain-containing protein [Litorilinea sp.]